MEVSPVHISAAGGHVSVAARPGGGSGTAVDTLPQKPFVESAEPAKMVGSTVAVEFARHSSGVQQVKFFDKRSGEVIDSLPCERVLDAVEALMDIVRKKA